jgi:hypothetical protein
MNTENLQKFAKAVAADAALRARVQAISTASQEKVAADLAALSQTMDIPFTAEEYLSQFAVGDGELSDEALAEAAGGSYPNPTNFLSVVADPTARCTFTPASIIDGSGATQC